MKIVVRKPTEEEILGLKSCPIWECRPSTFNWFYDSGETGLIIEGEATVTYEGGISSFSAGDLVIIPKGLSCIWTVRKTIVKHYLLK